MWLILTNKDTISTSDGFGFSTDLLLSIMKVLSSIMNYCWVLLLRIIIIVEYYEFIVHNLYLRAEFFAIWQKSVIMTVKNHEKYGRSTFFWQKSEINRKVLTSSEGWTFSVHVWWAGCIEKILISYIFRLIIVTTKRINIFNLKQIIDLHL